MICKSLIRFTMENGRDNYIKRKCMQWGSNSCIMCISLQATRPPLYRLRHGGTQYATTKLINVNFKSIISNGKCHGSITIYSLYKKKRKHHIIFNNLRTFKDEHFKLTGDLYWHVPYWQDEFHIFSGTITSRLPSSCKGTHETKSHKNSML